MLGINVKSKILLECQALPSLSGKIEARNFDSLPVYPLLARPFFQTFSFAGAFLVQKTDCTSFAFFAQASEQQLAQVEVCERLARQTFLGAS